MNQKFETIELKWKFAFNTQQELDLFGDLLMNLKKLKETEAELVKDADLRKYNIIGSLPLPTEYDAEEYANKYFKIYDDSYERQRDFVSGYKWTVDWINSKVGGNDR